MAENKELMLVKQIIADGYDNLEAISYELDIPMDVLIRLKLQIQAERRAAMRQSEVQEKKAAELRSKSIDKLGVLRRNYELVYNGITTKPKDKKLPTVIADNETVAEAIKKIDTIIEEKKDDSKKSFTNILSEIAALKNESMSIEQAEYLLDILYGRQLLNIPEKEKINIPQGESNKTIMYTVNIYRKLLVKKLVEAIKIKYEITNDIEGLKRLYVKLPSIIEQVDYVFVSTLKMRIQSKISKINREKKLYDMEHNLSEDIIAILKVISKGEIEDNTIDVAIENEVPKRLQQQKSFYKTTRERQSEQLFYQVANALENHAEKYPIQKPEKAIEILEQKFGMGFDANFRAVIHNLIERKEYVAASYFCDKYTRLMGENNNHGANISTLRSDIKKAEIGQIILRGIHANATLEEQNKFFDFLEQRMGQIRYSNNLIPLGRTKDGSRKITLADIWEDEKIIR